MNYTVGHREDLKKSITDRLIQKCSVLVSSRHQISTGKPGFVVLDDGTRRFFPLNLNKE